MGYCKILDPFFTPTVRDLQVLSENTLSDTIHTTYMMSISPRTQTTCLHTKLWAPAQAHTKSHSNTIQGEGSALNTHETYIASTCSLICIFGIIVKFNHESRRATNFVSKIWIGTSLVSSCCAIRSSRNSCALGWVWSEGVLWKFIWILPWKQSQKLTVWFHSLYPTVRWASLVPTQTATHNCNVQLLRSLLLSYILSFRCQGWAPEAGLNSGLRYEQSAHQIPFPVALCLKSGPLPPLAAFFSRRSSNCEELLKSR